MNIKNLIGASTATPPVGKAGKVDKQIKSENANQDKDANGQQLYERKKKKEKMTDEQFQKALALLRKKKFIEEMHWIVVAETENDVKYAWVKDQNGQTIRKIIEYELWELIEDPQPESTKGQLLKKTA